MDLSLGLVAVMGLVGYNFSLQGKVPRENTNVRKSVELSSKPSSENTYKSISTKKIGIQTQELANSRFKSSLDPARTRILPEFYNSMCKYDCEKTLPKVAEKSILPAVKSGPVVPVISTAIKNMSESPMFSILGKSIESHSFSGGQQSIIKEAFENVPEGISSLTGQKIDTDHNNMVPFFGSTVKQNVSFTKSNATLENFTGSAPKNKKTTVPQMFKPVKQNIYGTQVNQSRDRYYQSNLKTNVLPTPQVKVAPFLPRNLRPTYKTQEELNVNSRQTNRAIDPSMGVSQSQLKRGNIGEVSKNKVPTSWAQGPERLFTGSTITGAARRENYTNGEASLTETNFGLGVASGVSRGKTEFSKNGDSGKLTTLVSQDNRQTDRTFGIRNASNTTNSRISNTSINGYNPHETERDTTSKMTLLPAGDSSGNYKPYTQEAKVTNKQTNLFSHIGNCKSEVAKLTNRSEDSTRNYEKSGIENYIGLPNVSVAGNVDNTRYENMEIRGNKEVISDMRNYILEINNGSKIAVGSCEINVKNKDDTLGKTKYQGANRSRVVQEITNLCQLGETGSKSSKDYAEIDQGSRIDPVFVSALDSNPYSIDITSR